MSRRRYAIGVDFGTESGRAVLVDCADGRELGDGRLPRTGNGVIDERLPGAGRRRACSSPTGRSRIPRTTSGRSRQAVPALLAETGRRPGRRDRHRHRLHRLHDAADDRRRHAALPARRAPPRAARLGQALEAPRRPAGGGPDQRGRGRARRAAGWRATAARSRRSGSSRRRCRSCDEAPEVYAARRPADRGGRLGRLAADRRRDAQHLHGRLQGDVVEARRLPGRRATSRRSTRASRTWSTRRCRGTIVPIGDRAGGLSERAAAWTGLRARHRRRRRQRRRARGGPAATVTEPGTHGGDHGHEHLPHGARRPSSQLVDGMCGVVEDGIVPGLFGYEAGQSAVGDIFAWFVENAVPPELPRARARSAASTCTRSSRRRRRSCSPGESGLLALDWWNGNRSVLVDADLPRPAGRR